MEKNLTAMLSKLKKPETIRVLCESYHIKEKLNERTGMVEGVRMEGIAITFGKPTRNKVSYTSESGQTSYKSLIGKPFLDSHHDDSIRQHPPYGHIIEAYPTTNPENGLPALGYVVDLDPEEKDFIRKARRKDIPGVSIQVLVDDVTEKEDFENGQFIEARIKEFLEMSAVLIPGDGDSSMMLAERFLHGRAKVLKEDLTTGNGAALIQTPALGKKIRKAPEPAAEEGAFLIDPETGELTEPKEKKPDIAAGKGGKKMYSRHIEMAKFGLNCPSCGSQLLKESFRESRNSEPSLVDTKCVKCGHSIKKGEPKYTWYHGDQDDVICPGCAAKTKHTDTAYAGMNVKESTASNPEWQKYYDYLDGLRESGITNMFGARPYLQKAFPELDQKAASAVLSKWMQEFSESFKEANFKKNDWALKLFKKRYDELTQQQKTFVDETVRMMKESFKEADSSDCPYCFGTGECSECGGEGKTGNVSCTICAGSGECQHCNGSGEMEKSFKELGGIAANLKKKIDAARDAVELSVLSDDMFAMQDRGSLSQVDFDELDKFWNQKMKQLSKESFKEKGEPKEKLYEVEQERHGTWNVTFEGSTHLNSKGGFKTEDEASDWAESQLWSLLLQRRAKAKESFKEALKKGDKVKFAGAPESPVMTILNFDDVEHRTAKVQHPDGSVEEVPTEYLVKESFRSRIESLRESFKEANPKGKFDIGDMVWHRGKRWEIADHNFEGGQHVYALWSGDRQHKTEYPGWVPEFELALAELFQLKCPNPKCGYIIKREAESRPPKAWWDKCVKKAASFATDVDAFCGGLWFHPDRFKGGEHMKKAFGEMITTDQRLKEFANDNKEFISKLKTKRR